MPDLRAALRIKICGQTNLADAQASGAAGADLIGVILFPGSKRFVPFERAVGWVGQVPEWIERVAVFVDPTIEEVSAALAGGRFHSAQLHGAESPGFFQRLVDRGFGGRLIRAVRVSDASSLDRLESFPTRRFLLDGPLPGSGRVFDWDLAAAAVAQHPDAEFMLAGGLTAGNVAAAIATVRPHGVDVASGVESSPGRKDPEALRRFIEAVRRAPRGQASNPGTTLP